MRWGPVLYVRWLLHYAFLDFFNWKLLRLNFVTLPWEVLHEKRLYYHLFLHYCFKPLRFLEGVLLARWEALQFYFLGHMSSAFSLGYFHWAYVQFLFDETAMNFKLKPLELRYEARRLIQTLLYTEYFFIRRTRSDTRYYTSLGPLWEPFAARGARQSHYWLFHNFMHLRSRGPRKVGLQLLLFSLLQFWCIFALLLVASKGFRLFMFSPFGNDHWNAQYYWDAFRQSPSEGGGYAMVQVPRSVEERYREELLEDDELLYEGSPPSRLKTWHFWRWAALVLESRFGTQDPFKALDLFNRKQHRGSLHYRLGYRTALRRFWASAGPEEFFHFIFARRKRLATRLRRDPFQHYPKAFALKDPTREAGLTIDELAFRHWLEGIDWGRRKARHALPRRFFDGAAWRLCLELFGPSFLQTMEYHNFDMLYGYCDPDLAHWAKNFANDPEHLLFFVAYLHSRDPNIRLAWRNDDATIDQLKDAPRGFATYVEEAEGPWRLAYDYFRWLDAKVYGGALPYWTLHKDPGDFFFLKKTTFWA